MTIHRLRSLWLLSIVLTCIAAAPATTQRIDIAPDHADGIYSIGEKARWTATWTIGELPLTAEYTLKRGGLAQIAKETLPSFGFVTAKLDEPGTLLLEVNATTPETITAPASVKANSRNRAPVRPP